MFQQSEDGGQHLISPFTASDILAYIVPGATALLAVALFELRADIAINETETTFLVPVFRSIAAIRLELGTHSDFVWSAALVLILLNLAYVVGHALSFISGLVLHRLLVFKGHGYPIRFTLDFEKPSPLTFSAGFYRGFMFWANLAAVTYYVGIVWELSTVQKAARFTAWVCVVSILVKVCSPILSKQWNWLVRQVTGGRAPVEATELAAAAGSDAAAKRPTWREWLVENLVVWPFVALYDLPSNVFAKSVDSRMTIDQPVQEMFEKTFKKRFGCEAREAGRSCYWLSLCALAEHGGELYRMLINWRRLYEFARNLSTAFAVAAVYCGASILYQRAAVGGPGGYDVTLRCLPVFYWGLAWLMLFRYYYLFVCYYIRFLVRSFAYLSTARDPALEAAKTQAHA